MIYLFTCIVVMGLFHTYEAPKIAEQQELARIALPEVYVRFEPLDYRARQKAYDYLMLEIAGDINQEAQKDLSAGRYFLNE